MNPATLSVIQSVMSVGSMLLASWAHYRLNQMPAPSPAPVPPPAPHLGDGHILAALLQALSGKPPLPTTPAPTPVASDPLQQWLTILAALQQAAPPASPPTVKAA
jgi:hypothetical protein